MFNVDNADFIAEKLSKELLPNQEFREVLKNSLEAIDRRMRATGDKSSGRIEFDVDWVMHANTNPPQWFISCADNGDGMTQSELEKYTTTLAVQGAGRNQSLRGNQGMGLKISGPTRHKKGVLIRSIKNGERTMVQIGWNEDPGEYGMMPLANDQKVIRASAAVFPKLINEQQSGTIVTFLGSADGANTFVPPGNPRGWLFRYLNQRFFRLSDDRIEVVVRVPSGAEEEWPHTYEEAQARMRKEGKSFNLSVVYGTAAIWDSAAAKRGGDKGVVQLIGDATLGIPPAKLHWWVLPAEGSDVSSRTYGGGNFAVLYQNELHDWKTSNHAGPYFARLGVLFGKSRIAFVLEPEGTTIASDFARAHVLVGGLPVFETDAWLLWSEQFKKDMPEIIKTTIAEEHERLQGEDPDRMKRIRERLREVMQLLRPRRFRRSTDGEPRTGPEVTGAGSGTGPVIEIAVIKNGTRRRRVGGRGLGAVLADLEDQDPTPAAEITTSRAIEAIWVTEEESENMSIVNGNGNGMHDRAAALAGQDGRTANVLLLNKEFRGYMTMIAAVNEWANESGDDLIASRIEALVREWTEQKMIEAVEGLRQLENGKTWLTENYDDALSPVALTAAFMADRYHTLREVKRAVGAIRQAGGAGAA